LYEICKTAVIKMKFVIFKYSHMEIKVELFPVIYNSILWLSELFTVYVCYSDIVKSVISRNT